MKLFLHLFLSFVVTAVSTDTAHSLRGLSECNDDDIGLATKMYELRNEGLGCAASTAEYPNICDTNKKATLQYCPVTCAVGCGATSFPPMTKKFTLDYGGFPRNFYVHVPRAAREKHALGEKIPAVIMIHGTGKDGLFTLNSPSSWLSKADVEGFVAVFPSALEFCYTDDGSSDIRVKSKWVTSDDDLHPFGEQFSLCTPEEFYSLESDVQSSLVTVDSNGLPLVPDDVAFIDKILDMLIANTYISIDENQIYVTGNSNGGSMTARYSVERSTRINKATWNGGGLRVDAVATQPKPVTITIGDSDQYLSELTGWSIPVPINEDMLQNQALKTMVEAAVLAYQLDPNNYVYSEIIFGDQSAGEYLFESSKIGFKNQARLVFIRDHGHGYPKGAIIDAFYDFFIDQ